MSHDDLTRSPAVAASGSTSDLAVLTRLQHEFAATTRIADPRAAVPWCGRWRVRNLVEHLARIHHWAAAQAQRRQEVPLGRGPFELPELYERCAAELRETLARLDPGERAWTLLDDGVPLAEQRGTVAFWHRRQKLETLVHLWDLRTALDLPLDLPTDPETLQATWHDAVDEVVTVMHPRQVRLGRVGPPAVALTLRTDDGGAWQLLGSPPGAREVTVTGQPLDVALLLWGRRNLEDPALTITGDDDARDALAATLEGLTP